MVQELKEAPLSPEEEIHRLEQQLEAKKRALASSGQEAPPEKEVFREVLREHIETARPTSPLPLSDDVPTPVLPPPPPTHNKHAYADAVKKVEAREHTLEMLIEKAMTSTIENAVRSAGNDAYMIDELHDHLVDEYYDKLIQLRKIKNL